MRDLHSEEAALAALAAEVFDGIRALSPDARGVSRPAFSAVETATLHWLAEFARRNGLHVSQDAGRNLVFCLPQDADAERWVLIGSHVDSVPMGGNYDGLAGVVAGLIVLIRAARTGARFCRPVKCLAMRGEESAWFGACYLGSKMLTGLLPPAELAATHKGDARPLSAHLGDLGIDTAPLSEGRPITDLSRIEAYLELHIEQGPLLVERGLPAAVVSGIRGNFRHREVRCIGQAGHSGAVPRAYRHDPVLAFAELMHRLDDTWDHLLRTGRDLVLTSGIVGTDPAGHAISRIPDSLGFSLDIRSQEVEVLDRMRAYLRAQMDDIARSRGVRFETGPEVAVAPALMDPAITRGLEAAMRARFGDAFTMASGGGHDAAIFAQAGIPSGMVFVRNRNGSHNPDEAMELEDFMVGTAVLSAYLEGNS
ncbi:Zn-dependent hydrolase [Falsirhodobacter algicola]|uniref:Hydantoinase/carbamoylase family amidase n=1 Tax=Falsirhodobacter algicola TaxID=2692330 RepID=A0A8J8SLB2_9RHOB|nr:Zn-dependent hydrolase [Falsirhodobacter algicola]QUS36206.1 hydantoinase/carbamoylase family amidase [Falsirhodobacter algicola]